MRQGFDCAASALNSLLAMCNAGHTFLVRYLWRGGKGATIRELRAASALGLDCALVYEADARAVLGGAPEGKDAAAEIASLLRLLGLPAATAVYATSVDFSATSAQIGGAIRAYAGAVAAAAPEGALRGAYGQGSLHDALLGQQTQLAWVWGADDTPGTPEFLATNRWHLHQRPTATGCGLSYDPDEAPDVVDFGGFRVPVLMQMGDHGDDVRMLQHLIGLSGPKVDGSFGPQTREHVDRWCADRGIPGASQVDDELWARIQGTGA